MLHEKYILGFFILLGILATGCSKEKPDCGKCNQIEGTWRFESVKFRKDFSLHKTDITNLYKDVTLYFYHDKKFLYSHSGRHIDLTGYWDIQEESQSDGETFFTITNIEWYAEDSVGNLEEGNWGSVNISRKGIRATESKYGGTYTYRLIRD